MIAIYAKSPIQSTWPIVPSIFLAGPTPRDNDTQSWRPAALRQLADRAYDGLVYVPENKDGPNIWDSASWEAQITWEENAIEAATCLLFWIPRNMMTLPGLTTNVEFGYALGRNPHKVVLGFPPGAPGTQYLAYHASKRGVTIRTSLNETIYSAIRVSKGLTP